MPTNSQSLTPSRPAPQSIRARQLDAYGVPLTRLSLPNPVELLVKWIAEDPVKNAKTVAEIVVGPYGVYKDAGRTRKSFSKRNYGEAAFNATMMGLGALPFGGAMVKGIKAGRKAAKAPVSQYDIPAGSDPRYLGAATDRSDMSFVRHAPAQGVSERTADALVAMRENRGGIHDALIADIRRGEQLGGNDWYNTEELRDWFVKELGPEQGHVEWKDFMDLMGAASPGSKVDANIGNASAMRNRLATEPGYRQALMDVDKLKGGQVLARGRTKGYGHKTQGLQELVRSRQLRGTWDGAPQPGGRAVDSTATQNPKPKGFSQSLVGNARNIAADLHFTRYMAMASGRTDWLENARELSDTFKKELTTKYGARKLKPYIKVNKAGKNTFDARRAVEDGKVDMADYADQPGMFADMPKDNEYAAFEKYIHEVGEELGMTGPQVQANLWMGAADRTGVDPSSQGTFMELLRVRADKRAAKTGKSRAEVMKEFIKDKGLLAVPMGAVATSLLAGTEEGDYY